MFLKEIIAKLNKRRFDDVTDRLNYVFTSVLLLIFASVITSKEQFGSPIKCWVPAQFRASWDPYVENLCYVSSTYFLPYNQSVSAVSLAQRAERKIAYYQWVPILLWVQALMFYMPHLVWRCCSRFSGFNLKAIFEMAQKIDLGAYDKMESSLNDLCDYMNDSLRIRKRFSFSCVTTFVFLFHKLLFIANVVGQLYFLNSFFVTPGSTVNSSLWALQAVYDVIRGKDWQMSGHFPRVTMCDVVDRELGNLNIHSVQCVLIINMLNEKIFVVLWLWFLVVAVCTVLNFVNLLLTLLPSYGRHRRISTYIRAGFSFGQGRGRVDIGNPDREELERFVCSYLCLDGALIIRFFSNQCGELLTSAFIRKLYSKYLENSQPRRSYSMCNGDGNKKGRIAPSCPPIDEQDEEENPGFKETFLYNNNPRTASSKRTNKAAMFV